MFITVNDISNAYHNFSCSMWPTSLVLMQKKLFLQVAPQNQTILRWRYREQNFLTARSAEKFCYCTAGICLFKFNNGNTRKMWNLFRVNNKDTRTTSMTFWCLYRWLLTGFTHCSGVSIADTEQVNTGFLCFSKVTKLCLKVVSATFLLVCFVCLKESTCKTRRNAFISRQNLFSFFR